MRCIGSVAVTLALSATLGSACGPKRVATAPPPPPPPPPPAVVVLLPDADGKVGRVRVSNEFGAVDLTTARQSTSASPARRPGPVTTMSEADIKRVFGDALAVLPEAPRYFTLYFQFESDQLTDASRRWCPRSSRPSRSDRFRRSPCVGHTDTTGTPRANLELGLKRAGTVRDILVKAGLDRSADRSDLAR